MKTTIQSTYAQRALSLKKAATMAAIGFGVVALTSVSASAGSDQTFSTLATMLDSWLVGSLGVVLALAGVVYTAFSLFRGQWGGAAVGIGVAAICAFGPAIVTGMFTFVI